MCVYTLNKFHKTIYYVQTMHYDTLSYSILIYPTLSYTALPNSTQPYLTLPYPIIFYLTFSYPTSLCFYCFKYAFHDSIHWSSTHLKFLPWSFRTLSRSFLIFLRWWLKNDFIFYCLIPIKYCWVIQSPCADNSILNLVNLRSKRTNFGIIYHVGNT